MSVCDASCVGPDVLGPAPAQICDQNWFETALLGRRCGKATAGRTDCRSGVSSGFCEWKGPDSERAHGVERKLMSDGMLSDGMLSLQKLDLFVSNGIWASTICLEELRVLYEFDCSCRAWEDHIGGTSDEIERFKGSISSGLERVKEKLAGKLYAQGFDDRHNPSLEEGGVVARLVDDIVLRVMTANDRTVEQGPNPGEFWTGIDEETLSFYFGRRSGSSVLIRFIVGDEDE